MTRNILEHPKRVFTRELPDLSLGATLYLDGWYYKNKLIDNGWFLIKNNPSHLHSSDVNICVYKGKQHSINDEPSFIQEDGQLEWTHYGMLHRIGGPAKITISKSWNLTTGFFWPKPNSILTIEQKHYYIYGKRLTVEEYMNHPLVLQHKVYSLKHL